MSVYSDGTIADDVKTSAIPFLTECLIREITVINNDLWTLEHHSAHISKAMIREHLIEARGIKTALIRAHSYKNDESLNKLLNDFNNVARKVQALYKRNI